jgi:glycyl-tRNA synthetase (class II)
MTHDDDAPTCTCRRCGEKFRVDVLVDDELWDQIRQGVNLLCGSCILKRIEDRGQFAAFKLIAV